MNLCISAVLLLTTCMGSCVSSNTPNSVERGDFGEFKRSLNTKTYGYRLVEDPTGKHTSKLVERFEVRSGDCSSNKGWSDCEEDRERSELSEILNQENKDTSNWYAWDFYVPPDWPNVFPTKTVLGQFHQKGSHPVWMFLQKDGGLYLDDQSSGRSSRMALLIPSQAFTGQWHRIKVHAKWAADDSGYIRVWVNDQQLFEHHGKTITAKSVYFKYGVYRSFMSRFKNSFSSAAVPTQIAYFTNVRKSATELGLQKGQPPQQTLSINKD